MATAGGTMTLDQLIALSDEMAALARAGVPLERGLIDAGRDLRGRLGEIADDLGERLARGERLTDALASSDHPAPEVYRAAVEAGLRSGRLSLALEGMATISRSFADARRSVGVALMYPLIVVIFAYALTLLFLFVVAPRFVSAFEAFGFPRSGGLAVLTSLGDSAIYWAPIFPILLILLGLRWVLTGRSGVLDGGDFGPLLRRIPLVGAMTENFRAANFADLLALLVEHGTPLDESVRLAGDASGDPRFRAEAGAMAEAIRRGDAPAASPTAGRGAFPTLLAWTLSAGRRQGGLAPALRHLGEVYRRKATRRAEFLRAALPSVLLLAIGAGAVALYGLLLFVPMTTLLNDLAVPIDR